VASMVLPPSHSAATSIFIEPFRWDQRVWMTVLRSSPLLIPPSSCFPLSLLTGLCAASMCLRHIDLLGGLQSGKEWHGLHDPWASLRISKSIT